MQTPLDEKVIKTWGFYRVLYEIDPTVKVKELVCEPGCKLSMQRHTDRKELWFFAQGTGYINTMDASGVVVRAGPYFPFDHAIIDYSEWHQLVNEGTEPIILIEIQFGRKCIEEDIERSL